MAATNVQVDPSQTTKDITLQPMMKIKSTNFQFHDNVFVYPEELKMLIVALQHSALSKVMFSSFFIPVAWLSLAGSTTTFSKTMNTITFQLVNDKKF